MRTSVRDKVGKEEGSLTLEIMTSDPSHLLPRGDYNVFSADFPSLSEAM